MIEKDLRKLGRAELLELLLQLKEENSILLEKNKNLAEQLNDKEIKIQKAGSIANAALEINGVFSAAEAAAMQYLDNIKRLSENQEEICSQMEKEAGEKIEKMQREARAEAEKLMKEAEDAVRQAEFERIKKQKEADEYWNTTLQKLQQYCRQHDALKELIKN